MKLLTAQDRATLDRLLDNPIEDVERALKSEWDLELLGEAWKRADEKGDRPRAGAISSRMDYIRSR